MTRIFLALALILGAFASIEAPAQTWPTKPIRIMVSIPPGGAPDITARVIADKLAEPLGQPIVVENRPGSNGNIAGALVVNSPPDGHTLLLCADSQIVINPHVYRDMAFDPMKDLIPVASIASNEFFLAANPDQSFKTFPEFIAAAKSANPPLAYASGGNGGQHHLIMEMLKARAGIDLVHVPFKGAQPAMIAVVSGEVPVGFSGSSAGPQIMQGRLRALATPAKKRIPSFPDVPTIAEFYPGFTNSIWLGLCAPRAIPESVVNRLRTEINKALEQPDVRERFARTGALEPMITTREEFQAIVQADYEKYGKIARDLNLKID